MKAVFLLFLVAVASASATPLFESLEIQLRNSLDDLVRQALEYVRWLLKRHEPYNFPPLPQQQLVDDDVNLNFSTSNVKLSRAEDFTIEKITNNLQSLTSSFGVTVPQAHLEGDYQIEGIAFETDVQGSGTFTVDIEKYAQNGDIQFAIVDHSLQIKDLKLDYDLDKAKFDVQGLDVEGIPDDEIVNFLNENFVIYLKQNKRFVLQKVSEHAKEEINKQLKGMSLQDVLDWIKKIVASTPDPPPFPF